LDLHNARKPCGLNWPQFFFDEQTQHPKKLHPQRQQFQRQLTERVIRPRQIADFAFVRIITREFPI
jgi:hypothetical protein